MMISMLVNYKFDSMLCMQNDKFKLLCYQIDAFVMAYLPEVAEVFEEIQLSSQFYAS